jgi:hypothetical protein
MFGTAKPFWKNCVQPSELNKIIFHHWYKKCTANNNNNCTLIILLMALVVTAIISEADMLPAEADCSNPPGSSADGISWTVITMPTAAVLFNQFC